MEKPVAVTIPEFGSSQVRYILSFPDTAVVPEGGEITCGMGGSAITGLDP